MPQWRKLHTKTVESLDVNDMPDDFTRLLWVLLPTQLCREGRGLDSAAWVRSNVFPLRDDVTLVMVQDALNWFADRGMIIRYEANGRGYFYVASWERHQGNTSKEAESIYPIPPTYSRPTPDLVPTGASTDADADADADSDAKENNAGASAQSAAPPALAPETPGHQALFKMLNVEREARNWRPYRQFPSVACKAKFSQAEKRLPHGELQKAIRQALENGMTGVAKVTNYVAKWRVNGQTRLVPQKERNLAADTAAIMAAMASNGRHWTPQFDDPFLQAMVAQLDWFRLGEVAEATAQAMVKNAWFEARKG